LAGYRRLCQSEIARVRAGPADEQQRLAVARLCALGPGAADNLDDVVAWARRISEKGADRQKMEAMLTVAGLLLGQKKAKEALDSLREVEAVPALDASTVGLLGSPVGQGPFLAASALVPGRAIHLDPARWDPRYYLRLAQAHLHLGQHMEAKACLDQAKQHKGSSSDGWCLQLERLLLRRQADKASRPSGKPVN
jgi:hypothetical protein